MTNEHQTPLWEIMQKAYGDSAVDADMAGRRWEPRHGYAAELRALADRMNHEFFMTPDHKEVQQWLRREAARAEAGE
jgi:hypothetical protein